MHCGVEVTESSTNKQHTNELRMNYKDEFQSKLQATFVMFANDFCPAELADPPDAYQTMLGYLWATEFHEANEMTDPDDPVQKHWRPRDHHIDKFIQKPEIIDAFTLFVIDRFTNDIQQPPEIVLEHTKSIKGDAGESIEERFKSLVQYSGKATDIVFYREIVSVLERNNMGMMSRGKIDQLVEKLYHIKSYKPSKLVNGAIKQDSGFNMLCLCDVGSDEQAAQKGSMSWSDKVCGHTIVSLLTAKLESESPRSSKVIHIIDLYVNLVSCALLVTCDIYTCP
jgi:hypothetical protein